MRLVIPLIAASDLAANLDRRKPCFDLVIVDCLSATRLGTRQRYGWWRRGGPKEISLLEHDDDHEHEEQNPDERPAWKPQSDGRIAAP